MERRIKYYSTNRNSSIVSFKDALIGGQAPDKGLYMPDRIPKISVKKLLNLKDAPYHEIAFAIMRKFLKNEIPDGDLKQITKDAYNFDVPIEKAGENNYILRLDRGPTASFKDFAARMMARLIHYYIQANNKDILILTATSGDTGGAVANAFYGLKGVRVVVLFPHKEVSEMQRKQMTTLGKNVIAIAIDGKFDDCQAMVKQAFADPELKNLNLSSANSINIGRLLPQTVYYFYACSRLAKNKNDKILYSVPCGNFGNLTAGLIAKEMGLFTYKFVATVNENNEFPKFLNSGTYKPIKPSRACISSAMNVGHPSNLVRIMDLYNGRMDEIGTIIKLPNMDLLKKDIISFSISDDETRKTIKTAYNYGILLEPHGAVAAAGLDKFFKELVNSAMKARVLEIKFPISIFLETAHPAKFPEEIKKVLGITPKLPSSMKDLKSKKEVFKRMPADYQKFKKFLKKNF